MPFIRRNVEVDIETTFGKSTIEHEHYVKPTQVQKGDVVIPAEQLPDEVLADLALSHPKEFKKAALERGLVKLEEEEEDDEAEVAEVDEDDDQEFTEAQAKLMVSSAKEAVAMVEAAAAAQDVDLIAQFAEAEEAKDKPRKSVLEALAKAIGE